MRKNKRMHLGADKFMKECPTSVMKLAKRHNPDANIACVSPRKRKKKSAVKGKNEESVGKNVDSEGKNEGSLVFLV